MRQRPPTAITRLDPGPRRGRRRPPAGPAGASWGAALLTLGLTLAACGSDQTTDDAAIASLGTAAPTAGDGDATSGDAPTDPEEAMLAYTQCMRDEGIDLPDPQTDGAGGGGMIVVDEQVDPGDDRFQEAQATCAPIMEEAMGDFEIDPEQEAEMREQMLAFAACMRDQGIDFPDPTFGEGGRVEVGLGGAGPGDVESEEWQAAQQACDEELGGAPFAVDARRVGGG